MGAAASITNFNSLSAVQVGEYVASIGEAYQAYAPSFVTNGCDGGFLSTLKSEADVKEVLNDLQITKGLHQKVLIGHLMKLANISSSPVTAAVSTPTPQAAPANAPVAFTPLNIELTDRVTRSPREIMTQLFEIQGIKLDPSDIEPAVNKIVKVVGTGFGNGIDKFDCFINYRVAADADTAEMLYLYLKTAGVHAYLDKKCLKDGMKWKDGFLNGLTNSRYFVALISKAGLERVRNFACDHTFDNVLLEYETALRVMTVTENAKYICPIHVGAVTGGGNLEKFCDFNPNLYAESLEAVITKPASEETAPAVEEKHAPVVKYTIHESDNEEDAPQEEAEEEAEKVAADPYEGITFLAQTGGTASRYNSDYYCEVLDVAVTDCLVIVHFNVRGDGSLGRLQDPSTSRLIIEGLGEVEPSNNRILVSNLYQMNGYLEFSVDVQQHGDVIMSSPVYFQFGKFGYSQASIAILGSTAVGEVPDRVMVNVHEHYLIKNNVDNGWACNGMRLEGGCSNGCTGFHQTYGWERYTCPNKSCDFDFCRPCVLNHLSEDQSGAQMEEGSETEIHVSVHHHPVVLKDEDNGWRCDGGNLPGGCKAGCTGFYQTTGWRRFNCNLCNFDLCEQCTAAYRSE